MAAPTDAMDPEETLARWRAEEAAVCARLQTAPGVASRAQVAGRSGLPIFQALLAGEIPPPPMAVTLDFTLLRIEPGFGVFQGQPGFSHYNPMGTVHDGWYARKAGWSTAAARWRPRKAGLSDRTASSMPTQAPLASSLTWLHRTEPKASAGLAPRSYGHLSPANGGSRF